MYVVTVHFTIDLTRFDTFMELMHQQADNSIRPVSYTHLTLPTMDSV